MPVLRVDEPSEAQSAYASEEDFDKNGFRTCQSVAEDTCSGSIRNERQNGACQIHRHQTRRQQSCQGARVHTRSRDRAQIQAAQGCSRRVGTPEEGSQNRRAGSSTTGHQDDSDAKACCHTATARHERKETRSAGPPGHQGNNQARACQSSRACDSARPSGKEAGSRPTRHQKSSGTKACCRINVHFERKNTGSTPRAEQQGNGQTRVWQSFRPCRPPGPGPKTAGFRSACHQNSRGGIDARFKREEYGACRAGCQGDEAGIRQGFCFWRSPCQSREGIHHDQIRTGCRCPDVHEGTCGPKESRGPQEGCPCVTGCGRKD